jgi:hypothetical protein
MWNVRRIISSCASIVVGGEAAAARRGIFVVAPAMKVIGDFERLLAAMSRLREASAHYARNPSLVRRPSPRRDLRPLRVHGSSCDFFGLSTGTCFTARDR